jgi:hypothetical protein
MSEDRVLNALRALRDADAEREASPELEARLMHDFRRKTSRSRTRSAFAIAAGLAVVGLGFAAWRITRMHPETMTIATPPVPVPPTMAIARTPPHQRLKPIPELHEVVTEFFPLMDTPPPFERGELVRMSLPASTLLRAGFEVDGSGPDDSVEAEVLFGQEGLARAIRFVSYQQ